MFLKSITKSLTVVAAVLAVTATAQADGGYRGGSIKDAPYIEPFSWTGMYVGVNAGYAWANSDTGSSFACGDTTGANCFFVPASYPFVGAANSGGLKSSGFTGGVQAGYNVQSGNLVYGLEMDFNALDIGAGRGVIGVTPGGTAFSSTTGVSADWLFTARARLGMTLAPNLLAYVTGGLALSDLEVTNSFASSGVTPAILGGSAGSSTKVGYTIGGGLEYALDRKWSLKAEYLYVDFGSINTTSTVTQSPATFAPNFLSTSGDLTIHTARLGLNYKF